MKIKSVLSGVAAILLVSAFYIFTLGIVDEVDDTQISDEYLYSTETSEITSDENVTEQAINEYAEESQSTDISSAGTNKQLPAETAVPQTDDEAEPEPVVPTTYNTDEEPVDEDLVYTYDDQELYDDDDSDGLGTVKADSQSVYARDTNDYQVLAKQNYTVTTAPTKTKGRKNTTTQATTQATTQSTTVRETTVTYPTTTTAATTTTTAATTAATTANVGMETLSVRVNGTTQSMDAYTLICMIVQNEMSTSFTDEALKAQAVAAYSYVKYNNSTGISPSVLVNTNVSDRVKSLVSSVWGVECYYNGSIAQTVYCASTAGYSSSSVNVWGGNVPYLVSVACPIDSTGDPNYGLTQTISESDMRYYLEKALGITLSNDPSKWLTVTSYVDTVYVGSINVDGQKSISGRSLRETVLGYKIRSASFNVVYSNGQFVFTTYGYGHGVGMSQNGANILAKQGYTYADILKYYFTGITVQ